MGSRIQLLYLLTNKMSGYPGGGYPTQGGGYPGSAPPSGGYPGSAPQAGGYPGSAPPPGGYPGSAPRPTGGYPGSAPPSGGYPGQAGAAPPGGYPGYGAPQQGPPVDPQVQQWFNAVDSDRSGHISASELQKALVNGNWSNFSEEACRMMIDMYDKDKTGTIDIHEFQKLFGSINQWKAVFESHDKDRSGRIEQAELEQAFQQMGYRFTQTFVQNLLAKYDARTRRLTLDNFIVASVQIQRLTASFRNRDREMRGQATLGYEDFIGIALGAHN